MMRNGAKSGDRSLPQRERPHSLLQRNAEQTIQEFEEGQVTVGENDMRSPEIPFGKRRGSS